MTDTLSPDRRRFLQGGAIGGATVLAGCSALSSDDDGNGDENGGENGDENGDENGGENGDENGDENGGENGDENGDENGGENGDENGEPPEGRQVAMSPALDQQEIQGLQQQLQMGELEEDEYEDEVLSIIEAGIGDLEAHLEEASSITVDDEIAEVFQFQPVAVLRVSGPAAELIDVVETEYCESILSAADFDDFLGEL